MHANALRDNRELQISTCIWATLLEEHRKHIRYRLQADCKLHPNWAERLNISAGVCRNGCHHGCKEGVCGRGVRSYSVRLGGSGRSGALQLRVLQAQFLMLRQLACLFRTCCRADCHTVLRYRAGRGFLISDRDCFGGSDLALLDLLGL